MENSSKYSEIETDQLPKVNSPEELKKLPLEDLPLLAENIRRTLINCLSKNQGGSKEGTGTEFKCGYLEKKKLKSARMNSHPVRCFSCSWTESG
jgi:hypothetical protein